MNDLSDDIESILYIAREVMVYQVPTRTTVQGYKASDWNVEAFLWKGRLRVLEIGDKCELRLEDSGTGELFAQVNYTAPFSQVEPVLDSSRYFVLRVEGEGGKRAYIGMGFAERGDAFDFQVALQTVSKRTTAPDPSNSSGGPAKPAAPPKDYSLKAGQTFKINIPGREGKKPSTNTGGAGLGGGGGGAGSGGGLFALPPPPPPGSRKR